MIKLIKLIIRVIVATIPSLIAGFGVGVFVAPLLIMIPLKSFFGCDYSNVGNSLENIGTNPICSHPASLASLVAVTYIGMLVVFIGCFLLIFKNFKIQKND